MSTSTHKILTKPPNRGFEVRKPTKTTAEQEKALRDQLHVEIENKAKACSNLSYDCSLPRLDGHDYCIRHILQDSKAPYKQCTYFYPINGRRCHEPAPKHESKKDIGLTNYCFEHSRLAQLTKTKSAAGRYRDADTTESHLNNLSHHIKIDKIKTTDRDYDKDVSESSSLTVDPFVDIDCAAFNDNGKRILECASDLSSDEEITTVGNLWRGYEMGDSDNESIDSQNEDLLKHAGIYTTEEATMITKEKLIRLQSLYIEQFQRLQHLLKEKRRQYLHSLRKERENYCSIHNQTKDTPKERRLYGKLKALNQYHKKNGQEAILHKKYIEKRARVTSGIPQKPPHYTKCAFTEGGVKCGDKTLPCCKFCRKHILVDKKQILYRACNVEKSGVVCKEPIASILDNATCFLHMELPAQQSYTMKKYESETEDEEINVPPTKMDCLKTEDDIKPKFSKEKISSEVLPQEEIKEASAAEESVGKTDADNSQIDTSVCDKVDTVMSPKDDAK